MKQLITYDKIVSFGPCYDPCKYIPNDFSGTPLDILKNRDIPAKDRLWVVVRHEFLTDKQLHLYGLACARMSEKYTTDERVKQCNDVVERYLKGEATTNELSAAESAAWSAADSAADSAAESAAESARSAAESARSAAWSAAWSAKSAAKSAADSAAWSPRSAAESAWSAAQETQCEALIKIVTEVNE